MKHVHLATALCVRERCVLLVASRYANHPQPLWNLPGGRQREGELLGDTAVRECFEETGYRAKIRELAYLSESYDRSDGVHFVNAAFAVNLEDGDVPQRDVPHDDHVVEVAWVRIAEIASRIVVPVVRDPLLAYLRDELPRRYAGFADSGITIRWPSGST